MSWKDVMIQIPNVKRFTIRSVVTRSKDINFEFIEKTSHKKKSNDTIQYYLCKFYDKEDKYIITR